ncbi:MAG: class IV adenylate cyclase [Acidobacteriota bacterium]
MARNMEVKARVRDPARFRELVEAISETAPVTLRQEDVFFDAPRGRLKLRKFADGTAEIIYYDRADSVEPTASDYQKALVADALGLEDVLSRALGVRGVVRKERKLYRVDRTRIHLDRVEGLGNFMELEVELAPGDSSQVAADVAEALMTQLAVGEEDLIDLAYVDLLERNRKDAIE